MSDAAEWATAGIGTCADNPMKLSDRDPEKPWTLEEAFAWCRAAYADGYMGALKGENEHPDPHAAATELLLVLPVS